MGSSLIHLPVRWVCGSYARLDPWVVPLYLLLASLAPLALTDRGWWKSLASHGKTRGSRTRHGKERSSRGYMYLVQDVLFREDGAFWVPKRCFSHFYVVGLFSLGLCLLCHHRRSSTGQSHAGPQSPSTAQRGPALFPGPLAGSVLLHLVRRYVECRTVHVWSRAPGTTASHSSSSSSTAGSRMHVAGYLVGVVHYVLLPLVLWPLSGPSPFERVSTSRGSSSFAAAATFLFLNFWAQYQQHRHHVLLAQLRSRQQAARDPFNTQTGRTASPPRPYSIPQGGWFRWVSCPHYLAEILIYATWAALRDLIDAANLGGSSPSSPLPRHWILLIWVADNLTVSALLSHRWYLRHFPDEYPQLRRRAIFPGLL